MKKVFVLSVTLLLAACASPGTLRERGPLVKLKSNKTQSVVVACIKEAFEDHMNPAYIFTTPRTNGATSVSFGTKQYNVSHVMVDVSTTAAGSESLFYAQVSDPSPWIKWASDCQ